MYESEFITTLRAHLNAATIKFASSIKNNLSIIVRIGMTQRIKTCKKVTQQIRRTSSGDSFYESFPGKQQLFSSLNSSQILLDLRRIQLVCAETDFFFLMLRVDVITMSITKTCTDLQKWYTIWNTTTDWCRRPEIQTIRYYYIIDFMFKFGQITLLDEKLAIFMCQFTSSVGASTYTVQIGNRFIWDF